MAFTRRRTSVGRINKKKDQNKYSNLPFAIKTRRGEVRPNLCFLFAYLNDRYFDNKIHGFSIRYGTNMSSCYGYTCKLERMINISWSLHRALRRNRFACLMGSLLHEMCHAYLYLYHTGQACDLENQQHGKLFTQLLNKIDAKSKRLGYRYYIRVAPPNAKRDIERAYPAFRWRCQQCGEVRSTVVSRDINKGAVLSYHRGCQRRDAWIRDN